MKQDDDNLWSDEEIAGEPADGQGDEKLQAVANAMRQRGVELPEDLTTADELVAALHTLLVNAKGGQSSDDQGDDVEEPKPYLMSTPDGKQESGAERLLRVTGLAPAPTIDQQQAEWERQHRHPQ